MYRGVAHVCGYFTLALSVLMLVPAAIDLAVANPDWQAFVSAALLTGVPSALLIMATRGDMPPLSLRFGFLLVNLVWTSTSLVGALPLMLSGQGLTFTDAVFEAASAITTTGSTVVVGLDGMPPGFLLWRSMMQWFGGLGIIAMGLLLLPFLRVGGMQIYRMESSVKSDNPFARFAEFSVALVWLYFGLSVACALAYMVAGLTPFSAINHAMATISTGGFSIHDASMGHYGNGALIVGIVFMIAGALPFVAILRALVNGDPWAAFEIQVPVLLSILFGFSLVVALAAISHTSGDPVDLFVDAAFNIVSVVTTTGFASTDYTLWGPFAASLFLVATFLGGSAGSTSGGIKTYRLIILFLGLRNALKELIYPNGVFVVRYEGVELSGHAMRQVFLFLAAFMALLLVLTLILGFTGLDITTAFTGSLTAITNVGPGLGDIIGPAGNFSSLEPLAKWALTFGMIAGRLEILSMLVLFSPTFWRH